MKKATIGRVQRRRRVGIRQVVTLNLFADANFTGRQLRFRGNIGVRNLLNAFNFNDVLSSFELEADGDVTLVLFENANYRGRRLIFREPRDVETLADPSLNFNDITSSFIMVNRLLTDAEIDTIQRTGRAPRGTAEVLRRTRVRRVAKKKIVKRRLR
ncbi:hypothetical protein AM501_14515 [Aneurinibacillus migulanus]|uniref:hypothetical protein n=1 Tax=Aneurinibacillus migulanus TaxID=47500 RepID=UPI0005BB97FF|nr:hypothetical protein [Aneurinibacillus migulanus]KPD07619.1 hypothetical protein AM501_14515 [Aneurinibacillus migulanus]MED4729609.1 hypothetical protein [Aneurinibacillus migulanus]